MTPSIGRLLRRYGATSRGVSPLLDAAIIASTAMYARELHPVSIRQEIAERKRIKIVIFRHFRKRINQQRKRG